MKRIFKLAVMLSLALSIGAAFGATQIDLATQVKGVLPPANGGSGTTAATGTGSVVLSNSPTFTGTVTGAAITYGLPTTGNVSGRTTNALQTGYTSVLGDIVYINSSGPWVPAEANVSTAAGINELAVMDTSGATTGAAVTVGQSGSMACMTSFGTLTIGAPVWLSDATAGAITQTKPTTATHIARIVGYAVTAGCIDFVPDNTYVILQ